MLVIVLYIGGTKINKTWLDSILLSLYYSAVLIVQVDAGHEGSRIRGANPAWKRGMKAESGRAQSDCGKLARPTLYVEGGEVCKQCLWMGEKSFKIKWNIYQLTVEALRSILTELCTAEKPFSEACSSALWATQHI